MMLVWLPRILHGSHVHAFIARCGELILGAGHSYRPERHYMRGPGPKWHEKHRLDARA